MSSKVTQDHRDDPAAPGTHRAPSGVSDGWPAARERAPSALQADEPLLPLLIFLGGVFAVAVGAAVLLFLRFTEVRPVLGRPGGIFFLTVGLLALLYHSIRETDLQVRRTYGVFGFTWVGVAVALSCLPAATGTYFLPYGLVCFAVGLLFLLSFTRAETLALKEARVNPASLDTGDQRWRGTALLVLGGAGAGMALTGLLGGSIRPEFLLPVGALLALMGLTYLWATLSLLGAGTPAGQRLGLIIAVLATLIFFVALGRSALPPIFYQFGWLADKQAGYFVPNGIVLLGLSLLYLGVALGLCSDSQFVVQTRRELAAAFYSPLAYIVLFGFTFIGWYQFAKFVGYIASVGEEGGALPEPIVRLFIIDWFPVISVLFGVPVLTMHLFSEERRSGTLEMLLTTPIPETTIVLSKFVSTLIFYLTAFVPWALFLVGLRMITEQQFDYRPLLSFFLTLLCTGAGFISMGLFFSSLTRNQIAAAILTFAGMVLMTGIFFAKMTLISLRIINRQGPLDNALTYINYVDLWINSMAGKLGPQYLLFHISVAIFWLFLTVKVLEARRWS